MKHLQSFESYLESNKQPLFHITHNLSAVLSADTLKVNTTADKIYAICLTRSSTFDLDMGNIDIRLVLDADKLFNDGFISTPYDEPGANIVKKKMKNTKRYKEYSKTNFNIRHPKHNLNLPTPEIEDFMWESEERIYKDIPNLGKYLIAIDLSESAYIRYKEELYNYLEKYPHIKLIKLIYDKYWNRYNEFPM